MGVTPGIWMMLPLTHRSDLDLPLLEEVVTFIINDNECGEIFDIDTENCLHSQLGVFQNLDIFDAILSQNGRWASN